MGDFLAFRRMLAPILIHIMFWVGVLGSLALGGAILGGAIDPMKWVEDKNIAGGVPQNIRDMGDNLKLFLGIGIMVLGPLMVRLYCELLMLPFRINGTLTDIRTTLIEQNERMPMPLPVRRG